VQAALGGATSTLSIDLSNTYLDWARRNFLLNKIGGKNHRLKKADCIDYLSSKYEKFDLIFLDPPTFSNSKSSSNVLDVQKDHGMLIRNAMNKLERDGLLIFSTNKLNFKLDSESLKKFEIRDYTKSSLGKDFQRRKIHQTWLISHKWSPPTY
jgi:23S rRNA (guanine2445-N2)-methyltransferase / 23S rRNA (guanine2069-N7)-methyltransferase